MALQTHRFINMKTKEEAKDKTPKVSQHNSKSLWRKVKTPNSIKYTCTSD